MSHYPIIIILMSLYFGSPMVAEKYSITQTLTHIPLDLANDNKFARLNDVAEVYLALCQKYVRYFCTKVSPGGYTKYVFESELSKRWQRVAQQAAGIAQSWRSNRDKAFTKFEKRLAWFEQQSPDASKKVPEWQEFQVPNLKKMSIQANKNVAQLSSESDLPLTIEPSETGQFDYWIRISTLSKRDVLWLPVKLAKYHKDKIKGKLLNSSVKLERSHQGQWSLSLTFDQVLEKPDMADYESLGIDVGITHFLTTSTGQQYGAFDKHLRKRQELVREKSRRKAKLRACLEKKGIAKEDLPSISSVSGQRFSRHVRQTINYAVNRLLDDHPEVTLVIEDLSVQTMRFKSKRMNALLSASNLAHIPKKIEWEAQKRALPLVKVNPAYSSQECNRCHHTHRKNRPNQQTFCCRVCGYQANADVLASLNLKKRLYDDELKACTDLASIKFLLKTRHQRWCETQGYL